MGAATEWDTFFGAASTYAAVLGTERLAAYRALAEAAWARVPTIESDRAGVAAYDRTRVRIMHIMLNDEPIIQRSLRDR